MIYPHWPIPQVDFPREGETTMTSVIYEKKPPVATIWLNRPEKNNALIAETYTDIVACQRDAASDPDIRLIMMRGKGKTFCAGGDLANLVGRANGNILDTLNLAEFGSKFVLSFDDIPKPTVAVVHGYALAGGFEIMMANDFVIATEDAKIGDFHIRRGLIAGCGPFANVARNVGLRRAKELLMSGKILSGKQAAEWGLINLAVPADQLESAIQDFIEPFLNISPMAQRLAKIEFSRSLEADRNTLSALEILGGALVQLTEDSREGINSFLEKREPVWKGK